MITVGNFYLHDNSTDVCALVLQDHGSGTYEVQWYNLGTVGNPWPLRNDSERIYMHPEVWTNITDRLQVPTHENA